MTDREAAVRRAAGAVKGYYVFVPASPWGGKRVTYGPMTEVEAREWLTGHLPLFMPECPPKLLRLVEDYAPETAGEAAGTEAGQ